MQRRVCGVLLCTLILPFAIASAQTSPLQLELRLTGCPTLESELVRTLLGIELSAANVVDALIEVEAVCDEQQAVARVRDDVVGELQRALNWQGVQSNARSRLFSLAVAEMVISARREHEELARQQQKEAAQQRTHQATVVASVKDSQQAEKAEHVSPTFNVYSGLSRLGSQWSWAPTLGVGFSRPWQGHTHISFQVDLMLTQAWSDFARGEASFTSMATTPRVQVHTQPSRYQAFAHCGVTVAVASLAGATGIPAVQGQRHNVLLWGPNTGLGVVINGKRLQIGASLSALWLTRPLHVRTVSGAFVAQDNALARIVPTLSLLFGWR